MTQGDSLSPASNTDSFAINATAGGGDTRLVLVDSGANTLYAESKRNLSNIRAAAIQITGVNGTSVAQRVGTLPPMVTNKGHPIFLGQDCVISNDQDIQNTNDPRTIVTPKHLNEMGISVYFANGTTVLLIADTVELKGSVIHQEKFTQGLALINLHDHTGGKTPPPSKNRAASTGQDQRPAPRQAQQTKRSGSRGSNLCQHDGKSKTQTCCHPS